MHRGLLVLRLCVFLLIFIGRLALADDSLVTPEQVKNQVRTAEEFMGLLDDMGVEVPAKKAFEEFLTTLSLGADVGSSLKETDRRVQASQAALARICDQLLESGHPLATRCLREQTRWQVHAVDALRSNFGPEVGRRWAKTLFDIDVSLPQETPMQVPLQQFGEAAGNSNAPRGAGTQQSLLPETDQGFMDSNQLGMPPVETAPDFSGSTPDTAFPEPSASGPNTGRSPEVVKLEDSAPLPEDGNSGDEHPAISKDVSAEDSSVDTPDLPDEEPQQGTTESTGDQGAYDAESESSLDVSETSETTNVSEQDGQNPYNRETPDAGSDIDTAGQTVGEDDNGGFSEPSVESADNLADDGTDKDTNADTDSVAEGIEPEDVPGPDADTDSPYEDIESLTDYSDELDYLKSETDDYDFKDVEDLPDTGGNPFVDVDDVPDSGENPFVEIDSLTDYSDELASLQKDVGNVDELDKCTYEDIASCSLSKEEIASIFNGMKEWEAEEAIRKLQERLARERAEAIARLEAQRAAQSVAASAAQREAEYEQYEQRDAGASNLLNGLSAFLNGLAQGAQLANRIRSTQSGSASSAPETPQSPSQAPRGRTGYGSNCILTIDYGIVCDHGKNVAQ